MIYSENQLDGLQFLNTELTKSALVTIKKEGEGYRTHWNTTSGAFYKANELLEKINKGIYSVQSVINNQEIYDIF